MARLIFRTPALRAQYLERQAQWRDEIAAEIARRSGIDPLADMRPILAATVALAALDTALKRWRDLEGTQPLQPLVDEAFGYVSEVLNLTQTPCSTD